MKTKRVQQVLGNGYIWFRKEGENWVGVVLGKDPAGKKLVPLKIGNLGAYNKVRLIAEIVK